MTEPVGTAHLPVKPKPKDYWLLDVVERGQVTRHGRSYRWWTSETEYELVTHGVKRLLALGLVGVQATYHDRGLVVLTERGRNV